MEKIELNYNAAMVDIVVVGVGGTGSNLVPYLMQLANTCEKVKTITLIDGDVFEEKNKRNQKCLDIDLGKSKSEVLASRYSRVYPSLNIRFWDKYIYSSDDVKSLFTNNRYLYHREKYLPILISCVDNNATRQLLHKFFYNENIESLMYIDSGNGTIEMNGQIVIGFKKDNKVILPPVADVFPEILEDNDEVESEVGCAATIEEHPQNIATNVMAATVLFSVVNKLLSFNIIAEHMLLFDAFNNNVVSRPISKSMLVKKDL